jgi:hypothetical protein
MFDNICAGQIALTTNTSENIRASSMISTNILWGSEAKNMLSTNYAWSFKSNKHVVDKYFMGMGTKYD